jgi:hypothetical protein
LDQFVLMIFLECSFKLCFRTRIQFFWFPIRVGNNSAKFFCFNNHRTKASSINQPILSWMKIHSNGVLIQIFFWFECKQITIKIGVFYFQKFLWEILLQLWKIGSNEKLNMILCLNGVTFIKSICICTNLFHDRSGSSEERQ